MEKEEDSMSLIDLAEDINSYSNGALKKTINLLFIGKSGSGKTTLINMIANLFYGVDYEDSRKVLITQRIDLSQTGKIKKHFLLKKNIFSQNEISASEEGKLTQNKSQTTSTKFTI